MNQAAANGTPEGFSGGGRLGVLDAVGMGWRLMMGDFWLLWLVSFIAHLITGFSGPAALVVGPPMAAGVFYVLGRRMRGERVEVGQVFQGFSQRFKQSFIAGLMPYGVQIIAPMIWLPFHIVLVFAAMGGTAAASENEAAGLVVFFSALCMDFAIYGVLMLVVLVTKMFFTFAQCAVWDHPESGWEAAKFSVRLVCDHLGSVIGLFLLFALIWILGMVGGYAACCVGLFFTMPLVSLWYSATLICLYRSWTGQALVQPVVQASPTAGAPGGEGPIPPSDIQPPAGV